LLLIAGNCTADGLLPEPPKNAKRSLTDAEVVTLCVAQALLGIPSDRRFLAVAPTPARALVSAPAATTGIFQAPNPATART
jgi:hypothetical protein